jgi:hypothetical protein
MIARSEAVVSLRQHGQVVAAILSQPGLGLAFADQRLRNRNFRRRHGYRSNSKAPPAAIAIAAARFSSLLPPAYRLP